MFKVSELIETCAGRRQQNRLAAPRVLARPFHGVLQVTGGNDVRRSFERRCDAVRRRADRQHGPDAGRNEIAHPLELPRLVLAAEDQNHAPLWKSLQRLQRGVYIGSLRIVHPIHTIDVAHHDHSMRKTFERAEGDLDVHLAHSERARGEPRGQGVLDIGGALKLQRGARDSAFLTIEIEHQLLAVEVRPWSRAGGREAHTRTGDGAGSCACQPRYNRRIARLGCEDPILRGRIVVEGRVTIMWSA